VEEPHLVVARDSSAEEAGDALLGLVRRPYRRLTARSSLVTRDHRICELLGSLKVLVRRTGLRLRSSGVAIGHGR